MRLLDLLSGPYWYALYKLERASRDEDAALVARLKRENKRLRVQNMGLTAKLQETVALLKETARKEGNDEP